MAQAYKPPKKSNNIYKTGKLTKDARFSSPRKIDKKWLIILGCVLFSFVFAIIFGNILGNIAQNSQNDMNQAGSSSSLGVPSVDKTSPRASLHAYYADMSTADPSSSLSDQTGAARESGNALFFNLLEGGTLIYSSPKASELDVSYRSNLTLERLNNHFDYYNDYAVGLYKSDFSADLNAESRMSILLKDIALLCEATKNAFEQIIIEFTGEVHRFNAIYYEAYLLDLKLSCEGVPIGVKLPLSFLTSSSNSGVVAELLSIADFCAIDLGAKDAEELSASLNPLVYFTERYNAVIMLGKGDESTLQERISALESKGIKSYIIK